MSDFRVICSECGKDISQQEQGYVFGELTPLDPIFCSETCALAFVPGNLTQAKLDAIWSWFSQRDDAEIVASKEASDQIRKML